VPFALVSPHQKQSSEEFKLNLKIVALRKKKYFEEKLVKAMHETREARMRELRENPETD